MDACFGQNFTRRKIFLNPLFLLSQKEKQESFSSIICIITCLICKQGAPRDLQDQLAHNEDRIIYIRIGELMGVWKEWRRNIESGTSWPVSHERQQVYVIFPNGFNTKHCHMYFWYDSKEVVRLCKRLRRKRIQYEMMWNEDRSELEPLLKSAKLI